MKNLAVLKFLKENFKEYYGSRKYNYIVDPSDLTVVAKFINDAIFQRRIDFELLDIFAVTKTTNNAAGNFYVGHDFPLKAHINVKANRNGDNFGYVISVLCHELIHTYDYFFGEMKNHINPDGTLDIKNIKNHQYVGPRNYDAHGKYFKHWIEKFNQFGIIVKTAYMPNERFPMKNIDENETLDFFFDDPDIRLDESNAPDNPDYKDRLQKAADAIVNADVEFKYVDEDHWYIRID